MKVSFFASADEFRSWLRTNHDRVPELNVGFYKRGSGRGGITYSEALDEALCFGWIDGVRRSRDASSYTIRFSPRRGQSRWSAVNLKRAAALIAAGRMQPSGLKAHEQRRRREAGYSYENRPKELPRAYAQRFKEHKKAWEFFRAQPPGYRRTFTFWIVSAAREETRLQRLARLVEASAQGCRLDALTGKPVAGKPPRS
jgi:uncharacterized protein YdeI (YjbR/CyaY-like superfamily)